MIKVFKDKKYIVIALLTVLFLLKVPKEEPRFVFWVLTGVFSCWGLDYFISTFFTGRRIFPASAIVSGLLIGGILDYHQPFWGLIIFCILAVISKHIIRLRKRHIFNPANFALFIAAIFKLPLTWSIESQSYSFLPIIVGLYLAYSYKKFPQVISFLAVFLTLFHFSSTNAFGLVSWIFLFVMLIEPKTSGQGMGKGIFFGVVAGLTSFLIFRYIAGYDAFVISLFSANLALAALESIIK